MVWAASGPSQCQECFDDNDAECIERQDPQDCSRDSRSLGTTHCGYAKIKYASTLGIRDAVYRGCINCAGTFSRIILEIQYHRN